MSDEGGGLAIGSTTSSCVGESEIIPNDQCNQTMPSYADSERLIGDAAKIPDNTVFDARKQEEDEEAKQLLVDMIVNETMKNTTFMGA
ncbi:PREDICTED: heat shock 70 kDa protein cognate 1-like [Camelina sativa]|uniref:Heat shock 70 kDa protein cognate 1-like n=1 Tax=Camelina sativa TaxID=90675 RepID=A0ABM1QD55_CAMSA|nr:PREDICTED: heat shock 70 kDa protein cognate 1-like [Camelina sativa]